MGGPLRFRPGHQPVPKGHVPDETIFYERLNTITSPRQKSTGFFEFFGKSQQFVTDIQNTSFNFGYFATSKKLKTFHKNFIFLFTKPARASILCVTIF